MTPAVVGLDLSLTAAGYAGPDGTRVFTSTGHKGDDLGQRAGRLTCLAFEITHAVECANPAGAPPDLVVIEAPAFSRQVGSMHDRSGLWWLVVAGLADNTEILEVTPTALKKYITGRGNADKSDMRMAIFRRFGIDLADDNEADAFALRALGLHLLGCPLADMPAVNCTALDKLRSTWTDTWAAAL